MEKDIRLIYYLTAPFHRVIWGIVICYTVECNQPLPGYILYFSIKSTVRIQLHNINILLVPVKYNVSFMVGGLDLRCFDLIDWALTCPTACYLY